MELRIRRKVKRGYTTDGVLLSDRGKRLADTAEYTPLMLPAGRYQLKLTIAPRKYDYRVIEVLRENGSPLPSCTFIHRKNGVYTNGSSISIGEHLTAGVVIRTQQAFSRLIKRLEKYMSRTHEVVILDIG